MRQQSSSSSHNSSSPTTTAVVVVETSELLEENEREHCVWTEASVVRSEAFPETEEAFFLDQRAQDVLLLEVGRERVSYG